MTPTKCSLKSNDYLYNRSNGYFSMCLSRFNGATARISKNTEKPFTQGRIWGERFTVQPPKCSPRLFSTLISALFHFIYYHIKQNYCIFFSPKAFCAQRVLIRRLWSWLRPGPGWWAHDAPQAPLSAGEGDNPLSNPHIGASFQWTPSIIFFPAFTTWNRQR